MTKKNFPFGRRVRVINTNSLVDGVEGVISGVAMVHIWDTYIVSMSHPLNLGSGDFQSFTMPETCLEEIPATPQAYYVTEKNRESKRLAMPKNELQRLHQNIEAGLVSRIEIRISKSGELLYEFSPKLGLKFHSMPNYSYTQDYDLVSYAKAIKAAKEAA